MTKLPVLAVVREAYGFVWRERQKFWQLAMPGIVVLGLLAAMIGGSSWDGAVSPTANPGSSEEVQSFRQFFGIVYLVVDLAIWVMFSIVWHRIYLMPNNLISVGSVYRWDWRNSNFLFNGLKIFILLIPIAILVAVVFLFLTLVPVILFYVLKPFPDMLSKSFDAEATMANLRLASYLMGTAVSVSGITMCSTIGFLYARVAVFSPANVSDNFMRIYMRIYQGWRFTKGNRLWIFLIVVLTALTFCLLPVPFLYVIIYKTDIWALNSNFLGPLTFNFLYTVFWQFLAFAALAVGVSALSIAYKRLMEAQPPESAIAEIF